MKRACLIIIALFAGTAGAQVGTDAETDANGEMDEPRRYTVEVIIFRYAEDVFSGNEVFVPERIDPVPEAVDEPVDEADVPAVPEVPEIEPVFPFYAISLPDDELTMTATFGRLDRLDAYEPLMHFGWTQPTIPEAHTPLLPLARFDTPPPGLDGSLKLYLSRFLHLVVDLSLAATAPGDAYDPAFEAPVPVYGDVRARFPDDGFLYAPLKYRIFEDRIVKNGETRYYDHPKFGLIAKVTRVEAAEETSQDTAAAADSR